MRLERVIEERIEIDYDDDDDDDDDDEPFETVHEIEVCRVYDDAGVLVWEGTEAQANGVDSSVSATWVPRTYERSRSEAAELRKWALWTMVQPHAINVAADFVFPHASRSYAPIFEIGAFKQRDLIPGHTTFYVDIVLSEPWFPENVEWLYVHDKDKQVLANNAYVMEPHEDRRCTFQVTSWEARPS